MHVLMLGARAPACLEWTRAFSRAGWQVSVGDSLRFPITRFSRHAGQYFRLPPPAQDYEKWLASLQKIISQQKIDLVLPTCEEAFFLSHGKEKLPCQVIVPDFDLIGRLHHKGEFAALSRGWSIEAPETHLLTSPADLENYRENARAWVFKPAYSRFASYALICPSAEKLSAITPTPAQPWLAQRFIKGEEYCSYSLFHHGKLTASVCYQPRYRAGAGAGIYFTPVHLPPVADFLREFGEKTAYHGQVAFDFIAASPNQYFVIECNPRATSGVHLLASEPHALVRALLGENNSCLTPEMTPRQVGFAMRFLAAPKHGFQRQFWRDYCAAKDVMRAADDRKLSAAQCLAVLEMFWRALKARRNVLAATTFDIEWNGNALTKSPH